VYKVKVVWKLGQDTSEWWDQVCIWAIEEFGLPGNKYKTELTEDYMIFSFVDAEDALMARLIIGG
jgi:hypothetical protein